MAQRSRSPASAHSVSSLGLRGPRMLVSHSAHCTVCVRYGCSGSGGLLLLPFLEPWMSDLASDPARAVANFHTLFNAFIALVFLPILTPYAALLTRWLPKRADPNDPSRPQYLDEWAHDVPAVALGNAAREARAGVAVALFLRILSRRS